MFNKLQKLKDKGYIPENILDNGAHNGNLTNENKKHYDNSKYYLFEAIHYDELNRFSSTKNITLFETLLSDGIKEAEWYQMKNTGDSMFKEKTFIFNNCEVIKRQTIDLDSLIKKNNICQDSKNIFIKIDCQGAEIPILKGATSILNKTDFILLEIPLFGQYNEGVPTFLEHITFMNSINFIPYDIVDNHYINNYNMQIDMLFINKNHHFNIDVQKILL
jgi:hypothetical protein